MARYLVVAALASILVLQGCADEKAQPFSVGFDSGNMFYQSQSLVNESQKELLNNRSSLYGDTDHDGKMDAVDEDIDNDGVPNLLDAAPLNSKDKNLLPHLKLQVAEQNYFVVLNGMTLTPGQVGFLRRMITLLQKSPNFPAQLKVIALWDWTDEYDNMNGHYDPFWKTIRIRSPKAFKGKNRSFSLILGHELFHAFQWAQTDLYQEFTRQAGWSTDSETDQTVFKDGKFEWTTGNEEELLKLSSLPVGVPTRRSLISPEEHFADSFLFAFLREQNPDWLGRKYFDNIKAYQESENQRWTQQAFKRFFAPVSK